MAVSPSQNWKYQLLVLNIRLITTNLGSVDVESMGVRELILSHNRLTEIVLFNLRWAGREAILNILCKAWEKIITTSIIGEKSSWNTILTTPNIYKITLYSKMLPQKTFKYNHCNRLMIMLLSRLISQEFMKICHKNNRIPTRRRRFLMNRQRTSITKLWWNVKKTSSRKM